MNENISGESQGDYYLLQIIFYKMLSFLKKRFYFLIKYRHLMWNTQVITGIWPFELYDSYEIHNMNKQKSTFCEIFFRDQKIIFLISKIIEKRFLIGRKINLTKIQNNCNRSVFPNLAIQTVIILFFLKHYFRRYWRHKYWKMPCLTSTFFNKTISDLRLCFQKIIIKSSWLSSIFNEIIITRHIRNYN